MNLQGKVVTKKIQSVDLALIMNKRPHPPIFIQPYLGNDWGRELSYSTSSCSLCNATNAKVNMQLCKISVFQSFGFQTYLVNLHHLMFETQIEWKPDFQ